MWRPQAWSSFSLLFASVALPGCGGKSSADGQGDSNGGTENGGKAQGGGTNHGGVATGGSGGVATGGSGGVATGGSGVGGNAACDAYRDEGAANIPVRIVNATQAPLYLGPQPACGAAPFFTVTDAAGNLLSYQPFCQVTCQLLMTGGGIGCPAIACPVGPVLMLQPGEDALQLWNGLYDEPMLLTPECRPASGESMCQRVAAVEPGTFTFTAIAGTQLDCSNTVCMTCTPSSMGGCATYGGAVTGPKLSAETTVMLDGSYGLGGPASGGMVRSVEIMFKD